MFCISLDKGYTHNTTIKRLRVLFFVFCVELGFEPFTPPIAEGGGGSGTKTPSAAGGG